jgi:hypothetical protein
MNDTKDEKSHKFYTGKSSSKTNTAFNRKLSRSSIKLKKQYQNNYKNNQFYTNHYSLYRKNNDYYVRNVDYKQYVPFITTKFNNKLNPGGINNKEFSSQDTFNMLANKYCINCGNYGHTRGQCSEPNISIGVVAVRFNINIKKYEYLIVMRKHSHGYCDLIRGKYDINNKEHIINLLEETTLEERNYLLNYDFDTNWVYLWGENNDILKKFKNTTSIKNKFDQLKNNNLDILIKNITSVWVEPEWGFPKGQRDNYEKNIETAFREFCEETGYSKEQTSCISNIVPFQEIFTGSNNKIYKQLYFLSFMDYYDTQSKIQFQENELGDAKWATIEEVLQKFRYYDIEKKKIALNVDKTINNYIFVDI